jgi:DinB superfamily
MEADSRSEAVLRDFDEARQSFQHTLERVPEGALTYLKAGDDYALGGLVFHVNVVLENYLQVMQGVMASGGKEVRLPDPAAAFDEAHARARAGVRPGELGPALDRTASLHSQVRTLAASVAPSEWERQATVWVGANEPYPASPADVLGWLTDHYREHVPHAEELLREWKAPSS